MAWLSVATSNDELCEKLREYNIIRTAKILQAFKLTDRGDFVQPNFRHEAYCDRPFKRDHIHISAPHIYVTIIEALELLPGSAFLNIGSGSGYFSCLVACLLGKGGLSHGVEISAAAVAHSQLCCYNWFDKMHRKGGHVPAISKEGVQFVTGHCFSINVDKAKQSCKYDRIYVGAGCPSSKIKFFYDLLADDGVLVVPTSDTNELIKVKKYCGDTYSHTVITHVNFAPLVELERFTPSTVDLPPVLWAPTVSRNKQFPNNFRAAAKTLILGYCNTDANQSIPSHVWMYILSFAPRDWFNPIRNALEILQEELRHERFLRLAAEEKLRKYEITIRLAERERELYRVIIARMRSEHPELRGFHDFAHPLSDGDEEEFEDGDDDDDDDDDDDVVVDDDGVDIEEGDNDGQVRAIQEDEKNGDDESDAILNEDDDMEDARDGEAETTTEADESGALAAFEMIGHQQNVSLIEFEDLSSFEPETDVESNRTSIESAEVSGQAALLKTFQDLPDDMEDSSHESESSVSLKHEFEFEEQVHLIGFNHCRQQDQKAERSLAQDRPEKDGLDGIDGFDVVDEFDTAPEELFVMVEPPPSAA